MSGRDKYVVLMFGGGWGRQFAVVLDDSRMDKIRVRKWRRSGKKWTGPVWESREQVVNPKATAELGREYFKADLGAL